MTASSALQQQQQLGMQLWLYDDPHSEYCAKVKIALYAKGLTWQSLPAKPCGGGTNHDFQQRAPLGKIPALIVKQRHDQTLPEEVVWFEAEVINEWLEEQFPDPPLMPKDTYSRTRVRLISRFHDLYLEPALRKLYSQVAPGNRDQATITAAAADFTTRLQQLEQLLQQSAAPLQTQVQSQPLADTAAADISKTASRFEVALDPEANSAASASNSGSSSISYKPRAYAVGNTLTLADCGYPALFLYAEMMWPVLGLGQLAYDCAETVESWRDSLFCDGSVVKVLQELRPAAQEWLDSKLALTS